MGQQKSKGQGKDKAFGKGQGPIGVPKKEDITMNEKDNVVEAFSAAGPEINKILIGYQNYKEKLERECGKQFGGLKAFKKENREKFAKCRKMAAVNSAKAYINALQSFAGRCKSGPWDTDACLKRLNVELVDAKQRLQKAQSKLKEDITMKDIDKLVDEVFDGGFDQFAKGRKVEKKIDRILDSVELTIHSTLDGKIDVSHEDFPMGPGEYAGSGFDDSDYDSGPSKDDNPQKMSNDINHVPNQNAGQLLKTVRDELSEGMVWKMIAEMRKDQKYKEFFRSMLKKHGYDSPADIPEGKKKAFFNAIDAAWKAANEMFVRREQDMEDDEELEEGFKSGMKKVGSAFKRAGKATLKVAGCGAAQNNYTEVRNKKMQLKMQLKDCIKQNGPSDIKCKNLSRNLSFIDTKIERAKKAVEASCK